jgi:hypothetical protein
MHLILEAIYHSGNYAVVFPTQNQARVVVWNRVLQLLKPPEIAAQVIKTTRGELCIYFKNGSIIFLGSAEKSERLEGVMYKGVVVDESSDMDLKSLTDSLLPGMSKVPDSWIWITGVPKSSGIGGTYYKSLYEKWGEESKKDPRYEVFFWNDIVNEEFNSFLKATLDEKAYAEHALAQWSSMGQTAYDAFSDENIRACKYNPEYPVLCGMDFNRRWFSIEFAQEINGVYWFFDEFRFTNCTTRTAIEKVRDKYADASIIFYGDATSRQMKTGADLSDYLQIEEAEGFRSKDVKFPLSNPSVVYRISTVNSLLRNAAGDVRVFIDPSCTNLIRDLKEVTWREDERRQEDRIGYLTHAADAAGYIFVTHEEHLSGGYLPIVQVNKADAFRTAWTNDFTKQGRIIGNNIYYGD